MTGTIRKTRDNHYFLVGSVHAKDYFWISWLNTHNTSYNVYYELMRKDSVENQSYIVLYVK